MPNRSLVFLNSVTKEADESVLSATSPFGIKMDRGKVAGTICTTTRKLGHPYWQPGWPGYYPKISVLQLP